MDNRVIRAEPVANWVFGPSADDLVALVDAQFTTAYVPEELFEPAAREALADTLNYEAAKALELDCES